MFYINTALQGFILNPENTRNPASAYDKPVLAYHSCTAYDFQFLDSEGVPVPLRDSDTLTLALDKDYQRETPLMAWCGSAEIINAEQGIVSFLIDCSAESFYSNVKNGAMSPIMEIALYRGGDTRGIVLLQDTVTAKPRVQTTEGAPASGTPEYYNAAQVDALLKAGYEVEYSNDGETWGAAPDKVKFIRVRYQNLNGEWATIDVSSLSASAAGAGKSAYEIAVENGFEGDETAWLESLIGPAGLSAYGVAQEAGFPGTVHEWLTSLTGPQGEPGKNAYEVAQENGFTGTEEDFIASLKGEPGQDLKIDATGELSELDVYGAEPKGFTFAAAVTDPVAQTTKLYIYVKKSDSLNHWCNPTVITYYSRNGKDENVKLIPPMEFKAPTEEDKSDYISFSLSKYPAAYVAAVCIDTADGEYKLPYNSAMGVEKIVKRSDGKTYVYFGNLVPEYETGRIYFAQGVAEKTLWMLYQEQGGKYSYNDFCRKIFELIGEGETNPDEPEVTGKMDYGYVTAETAGMMTSLTQLTQNIIEAAIEAGTVTECDAAAIGKISMNAPAYSWIIAILPDTLTARKDDGLGGKVAFILDNGAAGSGANGADLTLGETAYKVYGELQIITAQTSIYIEEA